MNISGLLAAFDGLEPYKALREDLAQGATPAPLGLMRAARAPVVAALARDLKRPLLLVAGPVARAQQLLQSLGDWLPRSVSALRFPEPLTLFYDRAPWTSEVIVDRLRVLSALHGRREAGAEEQAPPFIVASARALMQRTIPLQQYRLSVREMKVGQFLDLERALYSWAGLGYEPVTAVESAGQFSRRGGIIDIFPPSDDLPVRIELWGNQVDSIRRFDPATQRSQARTESVTITPAREALPRHGPRVADRVAELLEDGLPADLEEELEEHHRGLAGAMPFPGIEFYLPYLYTSPATLLDHLLPEALVVVDDSLALEETWAQLEEDALDLRASVGKRGAVPDDYPLPYATWDEWLELTGDRPVLTLGHGRGETTSRLSRMFVPGPRFGGQLRPLLDHLQRAQAVSYTHLTLPTN